MRRAGSDGVDVDGGRRAPSALKVALAMGMGAALCLCLAGDALPRSGPFPRGIVREAPRDRSRRGVELPAAAEEGPAAPDGADGAEAGPDEGPVRNQDASAITVIASPEQTAVHEGPSAESEPESEPDEAPTSEIAAPATEEPAAGEGATRDASAESPAPERSGADDGPAVVEAPEPEPEPDGASTSEIAASPPEEPAADDGPPTEGAEAAEEGAIRTIAPAGEAGPGDGEPAVNGSAASPASTEESEPGDGPAAAEAAEPADVGSIPVVPIPASPQSWSEPPAADEGPATAEEEGETSQEDAVQKIILIGERHSGTNWITDHLTACFGKDIKVTNVYRRYKHWFQSDPSPLDVPPHSAVVVSMFRDPYDWVEAMRVQPHHAHDHVTWHTQTPNPEKSWKKYGSPLPWRAFVTRPWIGKGRDRGRGAADKKLMNVPGAEEGATCVDGYSWTDVVPCSPEDVVVQNGLAGSRYELRHDGSERAYPSIVDLRRDKILNHLSVANFNGTRAYLPYRYEDLRSMGTAGLLEDVGSATGMTPDCAAFPPRTDRDRGRDRRKLRRRKKHKKKKIRKHRVLPEEYVEWMDKYVDWEVEAMIGYSRRGG